MKRFSTICHSLTWAIGLLGLASVQAAPKSEVNISLHDPCNLFSLGEPVSLKVNLKQFPASAKASAVVTDYFGKEVWKQTLPTPLKKGATSLDIGKLEAGYYELKVTVQTEGEKQITTRASFGVVQFNNRTAKEVRKGNYRFGLKLGGGTKDFDYDKAMEASANLGLHWTRQKFNQVTEKMASLPISMIYKVEGLSEEAYDEKRYGPKDDFKFRHFTWHKATMPLEEPYKKWLKEEVAKLPKSQNIFEVWNEPWGKIPPEDFAKVAQWTKDTIREVYPEAKIGPNLSHLEYSSTFIALGGMEGMDAVFLHPYGHPERHSVRAKARGQRAFFRKQLGRDIDFYATEYGSPTPPEGARSDVTESTQAAWNVRRSLIFYAEDFKGLTPHLMAQDEKDPANKDDWYGHFRKNMQPKPALIALGTAARLIDGTKYIGDLFLKPDVGAMLFEREGQYILAMWTNDLNIPMEVNVGMNELTKVDIMGKETRVSAPNGKLSLNLTGDMVYLVGVSPDLAKQTSTEPRSDQWVEGISVRKTREAHSMKSSPIIDGKIESREWQGQTKITLNRSKVDPKDASAIGYVSWDKNYLYVAAEVSDDHPNSEITNLEKLGDWRKSFRNASAFRPIDSLDVFVGSQPQYQVPDFLYTYDMQMFFSPLGKKEKPIAGVLSEFENTFTSIPNLKMGCTQTKTSWSIELAIPLSQFKDFPNKIDSTIAFEMRVNDADPTETSMTLLKPSDADPAFWDSATLWSLLKLVK